MDIAAIIFFTGLFIVFHTYALYPVILLIWSKSVASQSNENKYDYYPDITLLIPGHNIGHLLDKKIENLMSIEYSGKLKYLFILDGCTDDSEERLKALIKENNKYSVGFFSNTKREGKEAAIKLAMPKVDTEIIIFSDADAILDKNCIKLLAESIMQKGVGAVCGREIHIKTSHTGASEGQSLFYIYEEFIKAKLANVGSLPYIQGGNFAMLKKLYPESIPEGCTQDGIIAFDTVLNGYKVAYQPLAVTKEEYNLSNKEDFQRRIRTISRAFYSILCRPSILNPYKTGSYFYHILSGRLLRWMSLPILIVSAISGTLSSFHPVSTLSFFGLFIVTILVTLGYFLEKTEKRRKIPYIAYYFIYIHLAAFIAIIKVLSGQRTTTWKPTN